MKTNIKSRLAIAVVGIAVLAVAVTASAPARAAGPWYVKPGGNDSSSCLSPAAACVTINGALNKPGFVAGDTIRVATGMYTGTGAEVALLNRNATLSGGWNISFTVQSGMSTIDGEETRRGIAINSGVTAVVERFVVKGGGGEGQGILNMGTLTLRSSHFHDNILAIQNTGTLTMSNSALVNNGGLQTCGGGLFNGPGQVTINNSTISGNAASSTSCAPIGGLANSGGQLTLNNTTVSDNVNGGLWSYPDDSATVRNSLIAGNTNDGGPSDCAESGRLNSLGYNLLGAATCTISSTVGDQIGSPASPIDPKLWPLTGLPGYHPLLVGSPAIDAGNPAGCMGSSGLLTTDQRGAPRVGTCDIGAYEYTIPGSAASIYASDGTPQRTPPFSTFGTPLQVVVLDNIGTPVNNAIVTFTAPASGASGTFADSGTFTTTVVGNGLVIAPMFTANSLTGTYTVTATVGGVITPANFLLSNFGWYVAPSGSDSKGCQSPATACATINGILPKNGFAAGDTVLVAAGTYAGTGDQVVLLDRGVRLLGGWNSGFTMQDGVSIIDGEGTRKGILVDSGVTAVVERFTIQNGSALQGGGISVVGGGIYNGGNLNLNSSIVHSNTAYSGGGISNGGGSSDSYGTLTLNNSTVTENTSLREGGGIANENGSFGSSILVLNNSTVSGNTSGDSGGGISNLDTGPLADAIVTLNNSTVSANTALRGGGIRNAGTLTLNNSTISGNTVSGGDGFGGGGIDNSYGGTATLRNTILAGNIALAFVPGPDCDGTVSSAGYNLIGNTSGCTFTPSIGDLLNINAKLFPLIGSPGYHPLLPGSPAIDAGNPVDCTDHLGNTLTADQRGVARVGRCDIGAYEFDPNNDPLAYVFLPIVVRNP